MNTTFRMLLVLPALLGLPLAASATAHEFQVTQTGENFDCVWSGGPRDNLVGGGTARMSGGGDNAEVVNSGPLGSDAGRVARMSGGGEDLAIAYGPETAPAAPSGPRATAFAAAGQVTRAR